MLAPPPKPPTTTNKAEFFVNDVEVPHSGTWMTKIDEIAYAPGDQTVKISAKVNASDGEVYSTTFTAAKGGIYLVVLVGRRISPTPQDGPRFMIIRTNPQ
jgi:hypothetical protein